MKRDPEKEAELRRILDDATRALSFKVSDEVRKNPGFWGKIAIELTLRDGRITVIEPVVRETIAPKIL